MKVEKPVPEMRVLNGVRTVVWRWPSGGTTVEATCSCFGTSFRVHDRMDCPNRVRLIARAAQEQA